MRITHMELIYYKKLAHVRNGNCIRYHVHISLQFVLGIDTMQSSTLTHAIAWTHCFATMLPFSLRWKIDYRGRILKKLKGSSITLNWSERKVTMSQHESGMRWTRTGNGREPHHGRRGGGMCNVGYVTKMGITEEHVLSRTRYQQVVVARTRYAIMPLDQNACYMPFNYVFLKLEKNWIKF